MTIFKKDKVRSYKLKKVFDVFLSILILIPTLPLILIFCLSIFLYDGHNPLYISKRVGYKRRNFKIYKIRTMVVNADKMGGTSTKSSDSRLLPMGTFIRKLKLDELVQLFNVINSTMSLVGPRPNTLLDVTYYSSIEENLLSVKPGITDFSSIVFADEGEILDSYEDPDLAYNQLIRPWKSKLGLFYISKSDFLTDLILLCCTLINVFNRRKALKMVSRLIEKKGGNPELVNIAKRSEPLVPTPPPGFERPIKALKK